MPTGSLPPSDIRSGGGSFLLCVIINIRIMKLKIKNPFKTWAENYEKNRREESIAQINRCVQLREFEGKIWICYNDIPLIEQEQLKMDICDTIEDARDAVCRYFKL